MGSMQAELVPTAAASRHATHGCMHSRAEQLHASARYPPGAHHTTAPAPRCGLHARGRSAAPQARWARMQMATAQFEESNNAVLQHGQKYNKPTKEHHMLRQPAAHAVPCCSQQSLPEAPPAVSGSAAAMPIRQGCTSLLCSAASVCC